MDIQTKEQLIEELKRTKTNSSELDDLVVWNVRENVLREVLKDREEDNHYFFEKLDLIEKRLEVFETEIKKKNFETEIKKKNIEIERLKKEREEWKNIANNLKRGNDKHGKIKM